MSKYAEENKPGYLLNLEDHARKLRACDKIRRAIATLELQNVGICDIVVEKEGQIVREKNTDICRTIESCGDRVSLLSVLQDIKKFI